MRGEPTQALWLAEVLSRRGVSSSSDLSDVILFCDWLTREQYKCYSGNRLCPILNDVPTAACGTKPYACYDPYKFKYVLSDPCSWYQTNDCSCVKGQLKEKSKETTPYTLKPIGGERIDKNEKINACGQAFYVTTLKPCSYCPIQVPQQGGKCPKGNETVFVGDSGMVCARLSPHV